jgi:hypothetical protein
LKGTIIDIKHRSPVSKKCIPLTHEVKIKGIGIMSCSAVPQTACPSCHTHKRKELKKYVLMQNVLRNKRHRKAISMDLVAYPCDLKGLGSKRSMDRNATILVSIHK